MPPQPPTTAASTGGQTPAPADIEITQVLRDECAMAGWPEPTREHVTAFLLNAKAKAHLAVDWTAKFKLWMYEEKKRMMRQPYASGSRTPEVAPPYHEVFDPATLLLTTEQIMKNRRREAPPRAVRHADGWIGIPGTRPKPLPGPPGAPVETLSTGEASSGLATPTNPVGRP